MRIIVSFGHSGSDRRLSVTELRLCAVFRFAALDGGWMDLLEQGFHLHDYVGVLRVGGQVVQFLGAVVVIVVLIELRQRELGGGHRMLRIEPTVILCGEIGRRGGLG